MTCNECIHKIKNTCPWRYLYEDTNYAEDCMDFTDVDSDDSAEEEVVEK